MHFDRDGAHRAANSNFVAGVSVPVAFDAVGGMNAAMLSL